MRNPHKDYRAVCHVCGLSWCVRGVRFTNHHRTINGKSVPCGGSGAFPEADAIAAAFSESAALPAAQGSLTKDEEPHG